MVVFVLEEKVPPSKELSMSMQLVVFLPFSCYYLISTTIERAFDEYTTCIYYSYSCREYT